MNFLAHLLLSGEDPEVTVGNFMGDFVKGKVGKEYPPILRAGIMLHRRIDGYVDMHDVFRRSRHRLSSSYGLYRGVMVDLFYDHFLAREWNQWSNEPLESYLQRVRKQVEGQTRLPERLRQIVPMIFEELLPSYREVTGVARALKRMSRRVARRNPLADGDEELTRHYEGLHADFQEIFPEVIVFAAAERNRLINNGLIA